MLLQSILLKKICIIKIGSVLRTAFQNQTLNGFSSYGCRIDVHENKLKEWQGAGLRWQNDRLISV
jgi:hypothetical protein